jgi:hypothetical protein
MIEDRERGSMSGPFRFEARVSGADPSPVRWAAVFLVFVLLAVAKPWGQPGSAVGSGRPDDARALTVAPGAPSSRSSPDPSSAMADAVADVSELCPGPGAWRTATRETWQGRTVGVWRAAGASPYGALLGPPAELGSTSSWPNGRVVFRYEELATGDSRWFAIEVSGTSG